LIIHECSRRRLRYQINDYLIGETQDFWRPLPNIGFPIAVERREI
jgi:hypothetical protein